MFHYAGHVKAEDNLKFLEGEWPNLESIKVEGKLIYKLCNLSQVVANNLISINLASN